MKIRLSNNGFISTKHPSLDGLLDGGFQYNTISHYYGDSGTGKTIFAMQLSLETIQNGFEVIWIDTNNSFDFNRLILMNHDDNSIASKIKLFRPQSYKENMELIKNLEKYINYSTKLIVLDPFIHYYRLHSKENLEFRSRRDLFNIQLPIIAGIVLTYDLHIILIGQTRACFNPELKVAVGQLANKFCKYVLEFKKDSIENKRSIIIKKVFHKKDLVDLTFQIGDYGLYRFEKC